MALTKVRGKAVDGGTISTETAGTNNLILGSTAGDSIASGGNNNVCVGDNAGTAVTTGDLNTFVGINAGATVATNSSNTAVGAFALDVGVGENNTAIGAGAFGGSSYSANHNTAVGKDAGNAISTGEQNVFVGSRAGLLATTTLCSTIIGEQAGAGATLTGRDNTCLGFAAGYSLTSGENNLLLGHNAGRTGSPGGNFNTHDGRIVLGDQNITEFNCQVSLSVASDERDKTDFTALDIGLDFVKQLNPLTYKWDKRSSYGNIDAEDYDLNAQTPDGTHKEEQLDIGFKAQEVNTLEESSGYKIADKTNLISKLSGDGKQYSLAYEKFVPILVKAIQELSAKNDALEARIKKLEDG